MVVGAEYQQVITAEVESLDEDDDKEQEKQKKRKQSLADRVRKVSASLGIFPSKKESVVSLSGFFKSAEREAEEAQVLIDVIEEDDESKTDSHE